MTEQNHWQLIPAQDFCCPSPPAVTRLRQGWLRLLRLLRLHAAEAEPEQEEADLPDYQAYDRRPAVAALDERLGSWRQEAQAGACFLLDPPYSGTAAIARDWADLHGWRTLTPPNTTSLERADVEQWWRGQRGSGPWLIDDLARYLLRTVEGMDFVCALLPRLLQGELGQGLVVCDSWMFAFVGRAWPLRLPRVYCFAPVGPGLLRQLGVRASDKVLCRLAARARGNPGLALALWTVERQAKQELPELPSEADDVTAFVLYTLLLHRGLGVALLQRVLPVVSPDLLNVQLLRLEQCGIVLREEERWRVSIHGYLVVRDFLTERDFWPDGF
ncbi:hypothetical protein AN401_08380 [Zobellella denitrificans]|uniref:Uncharacterized protein n=1 Tax=Zobellella denitrificans TaxID=347534 RepID=A0A291HP17_9GAMM|nr:hypothetical protein [Zobellella denitrificans]ATG73872.1 hypothetical protein AN401_08380 [Zobellella denitrificans]